MFGLWGQSRRVLGLCRSARCPVGEGPVPEVGHRMSPISFSLGCSRCQFAVEIAAVCKVEITLVLILGKISDMLQESCDGRGKRWLNKSFRLLWEAKKQCLLEPKDCEGMSSMALCTPGMWSGVSGERRTSWSQSASAWECLAAILSTQCTIGELSLKSATWAPFRVISSMTIQRRRSPASSKSEPRHVWCLPLATASKKMFFLMIMRLIPCEEASFKVRVVDGDRGVGFWYEGTCDVFLWPLQAKKMFSPMIMWLTPCEEASFTPM